jgi:phosphohistidine swiveling domain-containing protein
VVNTRGFNPVTGEWNDSLTGDYMWANTNIGETLSDVLTPYSWSVISTSFEQLNVLPGHPIVGNIGGRAYNNTSVLITAMQAIGRKVDDLNTEMGGLRREYVKDMPDLMLPLPKTSKLSLVRRGFQILRNQQKGFRGIPDFLAGNLSWCERMRHKIPGISKKQDLAEFCLEELIPYTLPTFWMVMASAWEYGERVGKLRRTLIEMVNPKDADALLSNVSQEADLLASLGPLVGLGKVSRGEMTRKAYDDLWGHRGPHESEVSTPRPGEDPDWIDQQLAILAESPVDVEELLTRQKEEFDLAWQRFQDSHRRKSKKMGIQLARARRAARTREAVRSELVRIIWVSREFALRAGELTNLGEAIFFLTTDEVIDLLHGKDVGVEYLPARQATHERYKSLPPYPVIIRGQFDPFQWATDPSRRSDFYDAYGTLYKLAAEKMHENLILGVPGSAGRVEGTVCRIDDPAEWEQLRQNEILVTVQTNVGWSPIFPLASAIVTDVGAPLSHAVIVSRELGIPAVVNCGDATMRLKTGDRVRVDGSKGTVEIL